MCTRNSTDFWKRISNLGVRQTVKKQIPIEVQKEDDTTCTDPQTILDFWQNAYRDLLNSHPQISEQQAANAAQVRAFLLTDFAEDNEDNLHSLNVDISLWEVAEAIGLTKHGKAMGHDRIPAEVLKNLTAVNVLHDLFNYCFKHGVTPQSWGKSIIHPIIKPGATDDPLQYLGINLISSISKICGSILNERLGKWSHEVINDC